MNLRTSLLDILSSWARSEVDARGVHERAEAIWEQLGEVPDYPRRDPRAIPIEVLSQLEILDQQLVEPQDIPQILAFLNTPSGQESTAWQEWTEYWDRLDYNDRAKRLKSDPVYSPMRVPSKCS